MITLILFLVLSSWVLVWRLRTGPVDNYPLTLPRGTIRGMIAILVISFPINYLLQGKQVPGIIVNSMFVLVAYYFQSKKSKDNPLARSLDILIELEGKRAGAGQAGKKDYHPLYLPKYSVRVSLLVLVALVLILNFYGPGYDLRLKDTIEDLFAMIALVFAGYVIRTVLGKIEKKRLEKAISEALAAGNQDEIRILERFREGIPGKSSKMKDLVSIIVFVAVLAALFMYSNDIILPPVTLPFYTLDIREGLLLLLNAYYGYRD